MSKRHCDTPSASHRRLSASPRLSYARRRANLGRHRLIPDFAHAITSLFTTTPTPHHNHNHAQNDDQDPTTGNHDSDGDVHGPDLPDTHTRALAAGINLLINTTARARTAWSIRGELAAWRHAIPDLPDDFTDAIDTLTIYQDRFIAQLRHDWATLTPTIRRLNYNQPSPTCWARPARRPVTGTWTGRGLWITHACNHLDHTMRGPGMACSAANRQALVTALAHSAHADGHDLTAAHKTIASRAITTYGCTLSLSTATQRLRTIRRLLTRAGFHHTDAIGGHLKAEERLAAFAHHGHRQTHCGNTAHLTLPAHLRPTPQPRSPRPAYATGLTERLAAREAAHVRKSTYSYTHRFLSLTGGHRGAHPRATAREQRPIPPSEALWGPGVDPTTTTHQQHIPSSTASTGHREAHTCPDTPTPRRKTPSLRAWRIADDLTRTANGSAAANGPYAALVGPGKNQCRLITLARLIDTHTPTWAGTRDVMRAIAHTATSQTTGFIALGLPRHRAQLPHNPTGWLTTLITNLTWHDHDQHPTWQTTATAFGVTWNGTRHRWTPVG
ncbi:hypothetical protein [Corynebacterium bovis]|uniref:hypothetical protein n=1 Tax=Corynebacterium bovis TaxID=36808 RepID=UPI000F647723|nr:hypothetical protein [Corynebacterium bovis]